MNLGGITLGGKLGGWEIVNHSAKMLPQALASATSELFYGGILGATYVPIWYIGSQLVNGTNHMLICEQTKVLKDPVKKIVAVVINIPAGSTDGKGASIVEVIDDAELVEGTDTEKNLKTNFNKAIGGLIGVSYTPVVFVGEQLVKGMNYFVVAEAKVVRPGSEPYAVMVKFNVFQDEVTLVSIEHLE